VRWAKEGEEVSRRVSLRRGGEGELGREGDSGEEVEAHFLSSVPSSFLDLPFVFGVLELCL